MAKYSIVSAGITTLIIILYFVILQWLLDGQTLGKKLLNIKIVKNRDGKLNVFNYLIRCVILNAVWANIILLIGVCLLKQNAYYTLNYYLSNIRYIIELVILIMVFMNKDARGLHDIIANTKVIDLKKIDNKEEKDV